METFRRSLHSTGHYCPFHTIVLPKTLLSEIPLGFVKGFGKASKEVHLMLLEKGQNDHAKQETTYQQLSCNPSAR